MISCNNVYFRYRCDKKTLNSCRTLLFACFSSRRITLSSVVYLNSSALSFGIFALYSGQSLLTSRNFHHCHRECPESSPLCPETSTTVIVNVLNLHPCVPELSLCHRECPESSLLCPGTSTTVFLNVAPCHPERSEGSFSPVLKQQCKTTSYLCLP